MVILFIYFSKEVDSLEIVSVLSAFVLIIWAAIEDLRSYRIPNRLIVAGIITGCVFLLINVLAGNSVNRYLFGALAGFGGMMFLHIIGAVGAGDVKLFLVLGMLLGTEYIVMLMGTSIIMGVVTGVIELCVKKTVPVERGRLGCRMHGFHYAVAVLCGFVVVLMFILYR